MMILWTDGSANPNPGPGGWAVICDGKPVRIGREDNTTNIRMEGRALIAAFKYAEEVGEPCEIRTDSEFWINVLTKWAKNWEVNGWQSAGGKPVKNADLVKELYQIYKNSKNVTIKWVHGHSGVDENELADEWANKARKGVKI